MKRFLLGVLIGLLLAGGGVARAGLVIAEDLLVNIDAQGLALGPALDWANMGSLGGTFLVNGDPQVEDVNDGVLIARAVTFDGDGDWFIGPNAPLGIEDEGTRSIEAWVYNPAVADEETIVSWSHRGATARNNSYGYGHNDSYGAAGHWGGANDLGWNNPHPADGQWHHLAWTYDGTMMRVYSDGVEFNSKDFGDTLDSFNGLSINVGAQRNDAGDAVDVLPASMSMAQIRIHDGVLSADDVFFNYRAGVTATPFDATLDSLQTGNWNDDAAPTWSTTDPAVTIPTDNTAVVVNDAHTVTIQNGAAAGRADALEVLGTGKVVVDAGQSLTVGSRIRASNVELADGAVLSAGYGSIDSLTAPAGNAKIVKNGQGELVLVGPGVWEGSNQMQLAGGVTTIASGPGHLDNGGPGLLGEFYGSDVDMADVVAYSGGWFSPILAGAGGTSFDAYTLDAHGISPSVNYPAGDADTGNGDIFGGLFDLAAGMYSEEFAVRWTGKILMQEAGDYNFTLATNAGGKVWIDGQEVLSVVQTGDLFTPGIGTFSVADGEQGQHDIVVGYYDLSGQSGVELTCSYTAPGDPANPVDLNLGDGIDPQYLSHAPTPGASEPLAMTGLSVEVTADSTLNAMGPTADFGPLTLTAGNLTTEGAPGGMSFTSMTVAGVAGVNAHTATTLGDVTINDGGVLTITGTRPIVFPTGVTFAPNSNSGGVDMQVATDLGTIDAAGTAAGFVFSKRGSAALTIEPGGTNELANMTGRAIEAAGGDLTLIGSTAWAGANQARLAGGTFVVTDAASPIPALTLTDKHFTVVSDSTLFANTDSSADFGNLRLEKGVVNVTGAPDGATFLSTTVETAAPDDVTGIHAQSEFFGGPLRIAGGVLETGGQPIEFDSTTIPNAATAVGFQVEGPVDLGVITGEGHPDTGAGPVVVITKSGSQELVLAEANVGLENATFDAHEGVLKMIGTDPWSGATQARLSGGTLAVADVVGTPGSGGVPPNPLAYWKFDDPGGDVVADETGIHHGTRMGDAAWVFDAERGSQVLAFDGTGDYVDIPLIATGLESVTYAVWVNMGKFPPDNMDSVMHNDTWGGGDIHFLIRDNGTPGFSVNGAGPSDQDGLPVLTDTGNWHHLAVVYDGAAKTRTYYFDGELSVVRSHSNDRTVNVGPAQIAAWNGGRDFQGMYDDFVIYDRALSDLEVAAMYAPDVTPPDVSEIHLTVTADSTLQAATRDPLTFPSLTIDPGATLTTTGAPITFDTTTISGDGDATVGIHANTDTTLTGAAGLDGGGRNLTIAVGGSARTNLTKPGMNLDNTTFRLDSGELAGLIGPGGAFGSASFAFNGGRLLVSSNGGNVSVDKPVSVTGDGTFATTAELPGGAGDVEVVLNAVTFDNHAVLSLEANDGYTFNLNGPMSGAGGIEASAGIVNVNPIGDKDYSGLTAASGGAALTIDSPLPNTAALRITDGATVVLNQPVTTNGSLLDGLSGSIFRGIPRNQSHLNLDGASYVFSNTRVFTGDKAGTILTDPEDPNNNVLITGTTQNWDSFPNFNGNADDFVTAFSGRFFPEVSGTYNFHWNNDDQGLMYIDMNDDGLFENSERVAGYAWNSNGNKDLTAGRGYNVIYMAQEFGGGQSVHWYFTPPGGPRPAAAKFASIRATRPRAGCGRRATRRRRPWTPARWKSTRRLPPARWP